MQCFPNWTPLGFCLGILEKAKSNWIAIDCGYCLDCFRDPEIQVRSLTRKLMWILGGEALNLICD